VQAVHSDDLKLSLVLSVLQSPEQPLRAYIILDLLRDDGLRAPFQISRPM
jgi:Fur family transcriptional regulator, zinc uptake regulator